MKYLFLILLLISLISCKPFFIGNLGYENFRYNEYTTFPLTLYPNGKFAYRMPRMHLVGGAYTHTGNWVKTKNNYLILNVDKYLFDVETNVILENNSKQDSVQIHIALLRKYLKNEQDTTYTNWLVSINEEDKWYETNEKGKLSLKYQPIHKIKIQDFLVKYMGKPLSILQDSIISINKTANNIKIFVADNNSFPIVTPPGTTKFLIKNRKLFPVDSAGKIFNSPIVRINKKKLNR